MSGGLEHEDVPTLPADRRRALATEENPAPALDYLVEIGGRVTERSFSIHLRYIPDKLLLVPASFDAYLSGLSQQAASQVVVRPMRRPQWYW